MLDSDLVSEDSVMNEAAKFTALTHSRCGRAGDPGEGRGCRGDRLATSQPMRNPSIPWVLLSISYVLGRVLGARVVKTNDTQSLGGGTHNVPEGISARGRSLSIGREQMMGLLGGDQAIQ